MKSIIFLVITVCCICFTQNSSYAIGMAKITVKVVDEQGKPVEAAQVQLCFIGGCLKNDVIKGNTDSDGSYSISGFSSDGVVGGTVVKNGYYNSLYHHDFITTTLGMWQPWNKELKVVLRPKINPVPMYVRSKWVKIPAVGNEVGFDLIKCDWVAPHGLGVVADFVFLLDSSYKSFDERKSNLTITFSNKYDGIQPLELDMGGDFGVGSWFRIPRYAPEDGYQSKISTSYDPRAPGFHAYKTKDTYYFFRVRSEVDENGKLKRAMYGRLKGSLRADPNKDGTADINFYYALNPDYTRNMEHADKVNLFSPLPTGERNVKAP